MPKQVFLLNFNSKVMREDVLNDLGAFAPRLTSAGKPEDDTYANMYYN